MLVPMDYKLQVTPNGKSTVPGIKKTVRLKQNLCYELYFKHAFYYLLCFKRSAIYNALFVNGDTNAIYFTVLIWNATFDDKGTPE